MMTRFSRLKRANSITEGIISFSTVAPMMCSKRGSPSSRNKLDQHLGLARGHLRIEDGRETRIRVVDDHHRFGVAVAHTAHRVYMRLDAPVGQGLFEGGLGFQRTGGDAAGGHADVNFGQRTPVELRLSGLGLVGNGPDKPRQSGFRHLRS
jgi:hypothetical protein